MRHIKNIIVFSILYLLTGCSQDFLDENLKTFPTALGFSNIFVSPGWQSSSYLFKLPWLKEADYEITSKPSWLQLDSRTGHLSDSIAVIQCSATNHPDFEAVGIYLDFMSVKADGRDYKVPVAYITEGNPALQVQRTLTITSDNNGNATLMIMNQGQGILLWGIESMPDWLLIDETRLESTDFLISPNSSFSIPLRFKLDKVFTGTLTGTIVLSSNDKENPQVTINVTADMGTPRLNMYTNTVNFSFTESAKTVDFTNYGNGWLVWEFTDIPEWLTITPSAGMCGPYSASGTVSFSCNRAKLLPGQNSADVILKTNDSSKPSFSIKVIANAPGASGNIQTVDGNIADAVFNKNTNTLYYVTSSPNKLVVYDVSGKTVLNEISLSKAPTSFAISEDWTKAAVGHNGFISAINLLTNTVTATYTINYSVNDIAWAENDWFSYTQYWGSFSRLHWINIADGTLYDDTDQFSLDGTSIIKKVPNQPYLIATRNATSPSGFFAYDIATKSKKSYAHMDLTNFWFSENGEYIFAKNSNIYRTTSSTGATDTFNATINPIGAIKTGSQINYGIQYLYHSNHFLWILLCDSYTPGSLSSICQVEDNDYNLVGKYDFDLVYQPNAQTTPFNLSAFFVFVNKEGTEVFVLCKGVSNDSWVIQFISL